MEIKFSDGVKFETSGAYRVERRRDGLYLVGHGMLIPVDSYAEARKLIADIESSNKPN